MWRFFECGIQGFSEKVLQFSLFTIVAIETQEAIFLRPISSNMRQAAQWDA